ncbi:MAG TPA: HNH endonuclease [Blastocatellia bacterium]|nr:HNH endonuclease [Blastocatellia bacterium]
MIHTRKVLLLNASYEPLGIVNVARAVRLVWKSTAETVELDGERVLRSQHFVFPCPSVIRLVTYVDVRRRRSSPGNLRTKILMRDRYRCQYCAVKLPASDLSIDHILPRSRGGKTSPDNLCVACKPCNSRKGDRTPAEARMPLLTEPSALMYDLDTAAIRHAADERPEWRKYVWRYEPSEGVA